MWTICYTENGQDVWDRFEKEDLVELIKEKFVNSEGNIDEDILIFPPDAEISPEELIAR